MPMAGSKVGLKAILKSIKSKKYQFLTFLFILFFSTYPSIISMLIISQLLNIFPKLHRTFGIWKFWIFSL